MFSPQQRPLSDNLAAATSPATSPALPDCWSGLPTLYLHLMADVPRYKTFQLRASRWNSMRDALVPSLDLDWIQFQEYEYSARDT